MEETNHNVSNHDLLTLIFKNATKTCNYVYVHSTPRKTLLENWLSLTLLFYFKICIRDEASETKFNE